MVIDKKLREEFDNVSLNNFILNWEACMWLCPT